MTPSIHLYQDDCLKHIQHCHWSFDLSFIDPPFNQGKEYRLFHDSQDDAAYWQWVNEYLHAIRQKTSSGGAIYFMQREKNTARVMQSLLDTGWHFQNLIIWKKKTSAVPCQNRFGKHYQIIAYATNGGRARVFHRLKIKPPKPPHYKYDYTNGRFLTDVWDDIREMTSGYFAGTEALRNNQGNRSHKQQSPPCFADAHNFVIYKSGRYYFGPPSQERARLSSPRASSRATVWALKLTPSMPPSFKNGWMITAQPMTFKNTTMIIFLPTNWMKSGAEQMPATRAQTNPSHTMKKHCPYFSHDSHTSMISSKPSMVATMTSPATTELTPAGVPVRIMSPARNVCS